MTLCLITEETFIKKERLDFAAVIKIKAPNLSSLAKCRYSSHSCKVQVILKGKNPPSGASVTQAGGGYTILQLRHLEYVATTVNVAGKMEKGLI